MRYIHKNLGFILFYFYFIFWEKKMIRGGDQCNFLSRHSHSSTIITLELRPYTTTADKQPPGGE